MALTQLNFSLLKPLLAPILVVNSFGLAQVKDFICNTPVFGFDTETNVTKTLFKRKARTLQIGNRDQQYVIDLLAFAGSTEKLMEQGEKQTPTWAKEVVDTLRPGLESRNHLKVGHNLQFDYEVCWWCLGMRPWNFYDTMLVEKLIYAGRVPFFQKGFWALDDLVARYCHLQIDKSLQQSFDLENELTQEQVNYAALDTRFVLAVKKGQDATVEKAGLTRVAKMENNAVPAFGDMKVNGFFMNKDAWMKNVVSIQKKHEDNVKALDTYFLPVVGDKKEKFQFSEERLETLESTWRNEKDKEKRAIARKCYQQAAKERREWKEKVETCEGEAFINYGSNTQLLETFRKMGLGVKVFPNTDDGTLKQHSDKPAVKALQNYRETAKILSTYGETFLDYIDPDTGRIHSNISQIGADTGRTSSSAPNLQNIPKGDEFRGCFKARPGYKLVIVDMSGAELRIMAELSGESSWIDAFNKGWDVHSVGAEMMYKERWTEGADEGCPYVSGHQKCSCKKGHKSLRNKCKATNFKVAYGGEDLSNDLGITKEESNEILSTWRKAFPTLNAYLQASGTSAKQKLEARSFSGRRRLFNAPTWEKAREKAIEKNKKAGKDPSKMGTTAVSRSYYSIFGNIERQGKNTPIQAGNADIAKEAAGCGFDKNNEPFMWHRLWTDFKAELVVMVHDEWVAECPEENAEACAEWIKDCIKRAGAEFMTKLVMESEANISDKWEK